jgi:hypothetical protein
MAMVSEEQQNLYDETYRALGLFVVRFAGLLYSLETSTVFLITPMGYGPEGLLMQAALADRTAGPIVSSFFSVFYKKWEGHLTDEDIAILKNLRRELDEIVMKRNRLMHSAWMYSSGENRSDPIPLSTLRVRAHGKGMEFESKKYLPEEIDSLCDDCERLSSVVNRAVFRHFDAGQPAPNLSNRIRLEDGKANSHPG